MDFEHMERHIRRFVANKCAEKVFLQVKQTSVSIKDSNPVGSTVLAILWAKVLQHANNFPQHRYSYKTFKDGTTGVEKLILKVEDVTLTTFMNNGTLLIQGKFVLDWFKRRFLEILERYDCPELLKPVVFIHLPDDNCDDIQKVYVPGAFATSDKTQETKARDLASEIDESGQHKKESDDQIQKIQPSNVIDSKAIALDWEILKGGCVKNGQLYIYPLWRSLLDMWMANGYKVFIVTPLLDMKHLMEISDIVLSHKNNLNVGDIEAVYIQRQCDDKKNITQIKREVQAQYAPNEELYIEYRLFSKIIYPSKKFHCKFIAGVKGENAEVMITSANFHENHFNCSSMETIMLKDMSSDTFLHMYLNPLTSSQP